MDIHHRHQRCVHSARVAPRQVDLDSEDIEFTWFAVEVEAPRRALVMAVFASWEGIAPVVAALPDPDAAKMQTAATAEVKIGLQ
jgi:hypothetical protein